MVVIDGYGKVSRRIRCRPRFMGIQEHTFIGPKEVTGRWSKEARSSAGIMTRSSRIVVWDSMMR